MYLIKKANIRLDLNEFPFDFSDGYIDGSNQVLEPNNVISCGEYETVHVAVSEVDHTVYVSIDGENLIIKFEYVYDEDVCIRRIEFAEFEGKLYEIDNDLYCPELAQILKDRIYEIRKEQE